MTLTARARIGRLRALQGRTQADNLFQTEQVTILTPKAAFDRRRIA